MNSEKDIAHDLRPLEPALTRQLCSGFGPLSTVHDTPTG